MVSPQHAELIVEKQVELFTDGACHDNPGPGGWGVCYVMAIMKKNCMVEKETTNNRMELTAVIEGLSLNRQCSVKMLRIRLT